MAGATITLSESNGTLAAIVVTEDISNVNFGNDDDPNLTPSASTIVAQADGHSYEKWLRLHLTALGGGFQAGEGISSNLVVNGYIQSAYNTNGPVETDSEDAVVAISEAVPISANVGVGGVLNGQLTAIGYTDYIVLQLDVSESTPSGAVNTKTISLQWDEQ